MATVLEDIKVLVELDAEETIYDNTMLGHINTGMAFLKSNAIPVDAVVPSTVGADLEGSGKLRIGDYALLKDWLYFHCLQRFDATTMSTNRFTSTYNNWIESQMTTLLHNLKARYDV